MSKPFKPMLADKVDFKLVRYPILAGAKLDGIRSMGFSGAAMSRSMKPLPNRYLQQWAADHKDALEGLDGEMIVGQPTDPDVYRRTDSAVMKQSGEPDFTYYVFDRTNSPLPFHQRIQIMPPKLPERVRLLEQEMMYNLDDIIAFEERMLDLGYEGVILRDPNGLYKQGRSTTLQGLLLKVKRWLDGEAIIIGYAEEMYNGNEPTINELGHMKRSSHQAGKVGKGTLGAWWVRGINGRFAGEEFSVGGMNTETKADGWENRDRYVREGRIIKYKWFDVGVKDKPRHPKFMGYRSPLDMS